MKKLIHLLVLLTLTFGFSGVSLADTLTIHVETSSTAGTLRAAVYDSQKSFASGKTIAVLASPAIKGSNVLTIENLKLGTYGVALYHDLNKNEELDTNLFGAPNEPFGFSKNPKIKFSAPKFADFKFKFHGVSQDLYITLNGG